MEVEDPILKPKTAPNLQAKRPTPSANPPLRTEAKREETIKPQPTQIKTEDKPARNKKNKNKSNKTLIIAGIVVLAIIIIVSIIAAVSSNNTPTSEGEGLTEDEVFYNGSVLTEKDKETTKSTLDKYADINVKGYDQIEDENGTHNVVAVEVTNKSEETVSIAVDLAAKDNDDKVLDISSLYAEGITPGQTYSFNLFYYTELTADQLKSAKYDVYKAYIYTAPTAEGEEAETITIEEGTEE